MQEASMTAADDEAFLMRWSRRKAAARREVADGVRAPLEPGPPEPAEEPAPPLDLPDIASLDAASDYKPFLQPGVPPELRRDALRRLWRVNPIIGSLDGLDDSYVTQDFTDSATVVGDLRTAYRIGRGMVEALAEAAEAPASAAAGDAPPAAVTVVAEIEDVSELPTKAGEIARG
jgi:hypothetical protein